MQWLGEIVSLICIFYLSVAAREIASASLSLKNTWHAAANLCYQRRKKEWAVKEKIICIIIFKEILKRVGHLSASGLGRARN